MTKNPNLIYNRRKCQICGLPFATGEHGRTSCAGRPQAVTIETAFLVGPANPDESAQSQIYMDSIDPPTPSPDPHSTSIPVGASFA